MSNTDTFAQFELDERILNAIAGLGFEHATPIQAQAIPLLLAGNDVIGRARTGSGKTAAFGLPLLRRVADRKAKTLGIVLCPTRELALQVTNALRTYARNLTGVKVAAIYGGAAYPPQIKALQSGVSVVVGTPGRVIDHLQRGTLKLDHIEAVVIDEADEMLRMGFIEEVRTILDRIPSSRQVMLFSATMPPAIRNVASEYLTEPVVVQVERAALSVGHIKQFSIVVPQRQKIEALRRVLAGVVTGPTLVFARTRAGCAERADALAKGGVAVDALHGNLTQGARERVLGRFRARGLDIVIATDVAARGLDVEHITHVINLDLPHDVEGYVHRIGRTGRAGREGTAISFVTPGQRRQFRFLQNKLRADIGFMRVPDDAAIARHKQQLLIQDIADAAQQDLEATKHWIREVGRQTDLHTRQVAAAAVHLVAKARGVKLEPLQAPRQDDTRSSSDHPPKKPRPSQSGRARRKTKARSGKPRPGKGRKARSGRKHNPPADVGRRKRKANKS